MKIKKFRAANPSEAMNMVRREMGENAVILSTKRVHEPGSFGQAGHVEMTAAIDWEQAETETELASVRSSRGDDVADPALRRNNADTPGELEGLEARLEELRRAVQRLGSSAPVPEELVLEDIYRAVYAEMVSNDVDATLALQVVRSVRCRFSGPGDRRQLAEAAQKTIRSLLPTYEPEKRRFKALVGPTGVGKTTTAAKLAAREILEDKGPVMLVTSDTYRVAAVDQLRSYAGAMGARFEVVRSVAELDALLNRHANSGHVILDTEGRGQRDLRGLESLFRYLGARADVERHLVLGANTKPSDMNETIQRFRHASPERLIFTKIDETNSYGPISSESIRSGLPVSYLGTGQKVPEELLVATPWKVAELAVSALV